MITKALLCPYLSVSHCWIGARQKTLAICSDFTLIHSTFRLVNKDYKARLLNHIFFHCKHWFINTNQNDEYKLSQRLNIIPWGWCSWKTCSLTTVMTKRNAATAMTIFRWWCITNSKLTFTLLQHILIFSWWQKKRYFQWFYLMVEHIVLNILQTITLYIIFNFL